MSNSSATQTDREGLYAEVEQFLVTKKIKKEVSKADSAEFTRLWVSAASAEGKLTERLFAFLYRGFRYAGAKPLFDSMKSFDPALSYPMLASFAPMRNNENEIPLRLYLSLLACELLNPSSHESIDVLIKLIPKHIYNRENAVTRNAAKFVKSMIVSEIAGKTISQLACEVEVPPSDAARFGTFFKTQLRDIESSLKLKPAEQAAIADLLAWVDGISAADESALPEEMTPTPTAQAEGGSAEECALEMANKPKGPSDAGPSSPSFAGEAARGDVSGEMGVECVVEYLRKLDRDRVGLTKTLDAERSRVRSLESEVLRLKTDRSRIEEKSVNLESRLAEAKKSVGEKNRCIEGLTADVDSLKGEVDALSKFIEEIERGEKRQEGEAFRRIAHELRAEYQDYRDAIDLEMDVNLGLNMRDQLGSVFEILKNNGIEL